jgi:Fe2+ transport system protein FeoA
MKLNFCSNGKYKVIQISKQYAKRINELGFQIGTVFEFKRMSCCTYKCQLGNRWVSIGKMIAQDIEVEKV